MMNRRTWQSMLAAGALLAGASASAQAPRPQPGPRPAPAPAQAQAPAAATGQAGQLTEDARRSLAAIHLRNTFELEAGQVAQQRGQSQAVKDLGRRLANEAQNVDANLVALVKERGASVDSLPFPNEERAGHTQMMARLRELQGDQFDQEFVKAAIQVEQRYEQDLKQMRDRTPGQDARLKKWLDDTENVAEAHLAAARDAKRAVDSQRAARRTPAR